MTREEAQIIIGNIPVHGDECYSIAEYQEAKTMAISALSENKGKRLTIPPDYEEWNVYECSHCREEFVLIEGTPYDNGYNFCPNCGADMRGENK